MTGALVAVAELELGDARPIADASRDPRLVYLASLGRGSRRTMAGALELLARELGAPDVAGVAWWLLRFQHVAALRARLVAEKHAASYVNKILAALRGVLKNCARLGLMSREDLAGALDVQSVSSVRVLRGRSLGAGEVVALFRACADGTRQGSRDGAILALLYGCGLRRSEVSSLDLADLTDEAVLVNGKGNKQRRVYLPMGARAAIAYWVRVRGSAAGPLILPGDTRHLRGPRRCSDEVIRAAVERRAQLAGVKHCTPHDMRYSYTGDLLDRGADLVTVQGLLGHAQVTTTARYDRRGERARRGAAELLHVPFVED